MTRSLTVEGDVNAIDTRTILTAQGSITAPSLVVPAGMTKIAAVYASFGTDTAAAGAAQFLVRLGGNAVLGGEQVIVIGGAGGQLVQAGADNPGTSSFLFKLTDADISVRSGDTIEIAAEMAGVDIGDSNVCVTVVYSP